MRAAIIITSPMVIICFPMTLTFLAFLMMATSIKSPSKKLRTIPIITPSHMFMPSFVVRATVVNMPTVAIMPCAKLVVNDVLKTSMIPVVARTSTPAKCALLSIVCSMVCNVMFIPPSELY